MAYTKINWVNNKTKLNATNLNHMEAGIEAANVSADAALTAVAGKQDRLVSGTSIKTINNESLLGSGNINVSVDLSDYYTKSEATIANIAEDFGPLTVNGKKYTGEELTLAVGKVYELSGYFNGNINIVANPVDEGAKNTQVILNKVYLTNTTGRVVYSNQTKKKLVISTVAGTENYVAASAAAEGEESTAAIEVENSLTLITGRNSLLYVVAPEKNHAIKAQSLYMQGLGEVQVSAKHDGFHGSRIIRVDSGNYHVLAAKDGFGTGEAGTIQVLGGKIVLENYTEDGFDSQGEGGVVAGYDTIIETTRPVSTLFKGMSVLETVPTITGITPVSLLNYFGSAIVKVSNKDGGKDGANIEVVDGVYTTNAKYVYVKGYIEHPIVVTSESTDIWFDGACIVTSDTNGSVQYTATSKKLAFKGLDSVEAINYIINNGTGASVKSNKNFALQSDVSYILKAATGRNIDAFTTTIKGDGSKILRTDNLANINATAMYIGLDSKDITIDTEFSIGSLNLDKNIICQVNSTSSDNGSVKITFAQHGNVVCNDILADHVDYLYTETAMNLNAKAYYINKINKFLEDDLRARTRVLETTCAELGVRVAALEAKHPTTDTSAE